MAACGGERDRDATPALPRALALDLAARSDAVAARLEAGDACAARAEAERLQARTVAAVNAGRVPARYQEELGSATAALVASIACSPAPPPPPAAAEDDDEAEDDEQEGHGKAKGKGKKKGKKH